MSAGIERIHGSVLTGTTSTQNVSGSQGSFIGGYQLRFFDFAGDFTDASVNGALETLVRKVESVATVVIVGVPTSSHVILALDAATFDGRDDNTGYQIGGAGETATEVLGTLSGVTVTEKVINGNTFA